MIVAPERETPGIERERLREADDHRVAQRDRRDVALAAGRPVDGVEDQAEHDQRRPDQVQVPRLVLDLVAEREAEDADRDGAGDDVPAHPRVELPAQLGAAQAPHPRRGDPPEVLAEVQEDRRHRPELDDGGEGGPRVLPAEEGGHDPQVARARDRQELGQPLDDPEDDGLQGVHGGARILEGRHTRVGGGDQALIGEIHHPTSSHRRPVPARPTQKDTQLRRRRAARDRMPANENTAPRRCRSAARTRGGAADHAAAGL